MLHCHASEILHECRNTMNYANYLAINTISCNMTKIKSFTTSYANSGWLAAVSCTKAHNNRKQVQNCTNRTSYKCPHVWTVVIYDYNAIAEHYNTQCLSNTVYQLFQFTGFSPVYGCIYTTSIPCDSQSAHTQCARVISQLTLYLPTVRVIKTGKNTKRVWWMTSILWWRELASATQPVFVMKC